jgi:hypothetical protein
MMAEDFNAKEISRKAEEMQALHINIGQRSD